MIGKTMMLKERRKAHMALDKDGKPIRPYTNLFESMNNVISQAKKNFLTFNNKGKNENLSKLEFMKLVFEEIHKRQMRGLKLALCGLSEEYQLDETVEHLAVSVNTWFEHKQCKNEVIDAVIQVALTLLNHPSAIQQKPTLYPSNNNKYQVASSKARNKKAECMVNKSYVSCCCPSFKFDIVCKHSIAVADKVGILEQHIQFISKSSAKKGPRSALEEAVVNKEVAEKKGGKNKYPYRPSRSQQEVHWQGLSQSSTSYTYEKIHHSDNPFVLHTLPKNAKCKQCGMDFCH